MKFMIHLIFRYLYSSLAEIFQAWLLLKTTHRIAQPTDC